MLRLAQHVPPPCRTSANALRRESATACQQGDGDEYQTLYEIVFDGRNRRVLSGGVLASSTLASSCKKLTADARSASAVNFLQNQREGRRPESARRPRDADHHSNQTLFQGNVR